MVFNLPTNTLGVGSINLTFHAKSDNSGMPMTAAQWATLQAAIAPFFPPPIGTAGPKGATGPSAPSGPTGATK